MRSNELLYTRLTGQCRSLAKTAIGNSVLQIAVVHHFRDFKAAIDFWALIEL
jgi:hypothetical protein